MNLLYERKQNRLRHFDYSQAGWYFVTICTKDRGDHFGSVVDKKMVLNTCGTIVDECWNEIPYHFKHVELDEYVVMPDHVHGIVVLRNNAAAEFVGNKNFCSLQKNTRHRQSWQTGLSRSLSSVIRGFKIGVTKWYRNNGDYTFSWQKSFHDHIIRTEGSLGMIRQYIYDNPKRWAIGRDL